MWILREQSDQNKEMKIADLVLLRLYKFLRLIAGVSIAKCLVQLTSKQLSFTTVGSNLTRALNFAY